jgi:hypothetical protein
LKYIQKEKKNKDWPKIVYLKKTLIKKRNIGKTKGEKGMKEVIIGLVIWVALAAIIISLAGCDLLRKKIKFDVATDANCVVVVICPHGKEDKAALKEE